MAVAHSTNAYDMPRTFAEVVHDEPAARALYFRQWDPVSEFWLVPDAIDIATARRLRQAGRLLRQAFPRALIDFQLLNMRNFGGTEPESLIPTGAERRILH